MQRKACEKLVMARAGACSGPFLDTTVASTASLRTDSSEQAARPSAAPTINNIPSFLAMIDLFE